jgi:acyl-CoA dehydrogenase
MYAFDLTPDQKMLVETVHRFAEQDLRREARSAEAAHTLPDKLVRRGWELGLLPGSLDPAVGGFGDYSALTSALCLEELGWGDVGAALHLLTPNLFALPLALFGTKEQKATYLPRFCEESFPRATAALLEPVYQFDPAELATVAHKEADGFVIQGTKTLVPLAKDAEWLLVYAREHGTTQAYIVPGNAPGITVEEPVGAMGWEALATYTVSFHQVKVPLANRLGGLKGIRLERLLTVSRIALAAFAVGQARAAYEYALDYAKAREAFGEPIAHRQSIAFLLANMRIELEATRLLCWEAAYRFDQRQDATRAAARAKLYAERMVLEVTDGAVQVLGGHGYVKDHPVEMWLRNGRGFAVLDGQVLA